VRKYKRSGNFNNVTYPQTEENFWIMGLWGERSVLHGEPSVNGAIPYKKPKQYKNNTKL